MIFPVDLLLASLSPKIQAYAGDVSVSLRAPLEAKTGLIMFAVLTAVFLQIVRREAAWRESEKDGDVS